MISEADMTLLCDWREGIDLCGWFASEKYDGFRVIWDGYALWGRSGRRLNAPEEFLEGLPRDIALDAELWAGRGGVESALFAARYGRKHFTPALRLAVFDAVVPGSYPTRLETARRAIRGCRTAFATPYSRMNSTEEAIQLARMIQESGGEGIVLRSPGDMIYRPGRNPKALRLV